MSILSIPLATMIPAGIEVDVVASEADLQPPGVEALSVSPVRVRGCLSQVGAEYVFQGAIAGRCLQPCDRCLGPVETPFQVDVLWAYRASVGGPQDEEWERGGVIVAAFDGNEIDLAPQVWEEIVLAAPAKFLCGATCAGLCPRCGVNLNHEQCACAERVQLKNTGLADLAKLLAEVRPTNPED